MEDPAGASTDQRRSSRRPLVRFVWFRLIEDSLEVGLDPDVPVEGIAHSCDISVGGVGITISHCYPVAAKLFIEIATGSFNISAVGRVAHIKPVGNQFFLGIEFVVMPPNDRLLLNKICGGETGS